MKIYRAKKGFIIRAMGDDHLIVAVGEAADVFNGFIRTNGTGAFFWHELEKGITKEDLVRKMLEKYEGLDEEKANRDLDEYLDRMTVAIEAEEYAE
ncbi:MAG: PqqD family protein [Clostridia bacterium]|nr:PqqD family protein [Clostridia bacterium]